MRSWDSSASHERLKLKTLTRMRIYNGDTVSREDVSLPDSATMLQSTLSTYVQSRVSTEDRYGARYSSKTSARTSLSSWSLLLPHLYLLSTLFVTTRFHSILSARISTLVNATLPKLPLHCWRSLNSFRFLLINFDNKLIYWILHIFWCSVNVNIGLILL